MEIIVVLIIALIVLGPKKLPEVARSVGKGVREFKGALTMDSSDDEPERKPKADPDEAATRPSAP
jgi:sec-independent protein translocase protein TatA